VPIFDVLIDIFMYYAYVLQSERTGRNYFGSCEDLQHRLARDNAGKVRSTKAYRPYKLIYFEEFATRSQAFRRERFFKSIEGRIFLKRMGILITRTCDSQRFFLQL
jgi:putative endonuclease